jgi:hypothetical protein
VGRRQEEGCCQGKKVRFNQKGGEKHRAEIRNREEGGAASSSTAPEAVMSGGTVSLFTDRSDKDWTGA